MNKNYFRTSEVVAYLESLIHDNAATNEQEELYLQFIWNGELDKNYTYKLTVKQMKFECEQGF